MTDTNSSLQISKDVVTLQSPQSMADFANTLKSFIAHQKLYTTIGGKAYVHVEAWQFCGASMGIIPIVRATERIDSKDETEVKYRAEVELRRLDNDQLVGAGIAFCSNKESRKKNFDEYAVASMAQTRATSKAFRIAFGWLMKMSGYEATPSEEMDDVSDEVTQDQIDLIWKLGKEKKQSDEVIKRRLSTVKTQKDASDAIQNLLLLGSD